MFLGFGFDNDFKRGDVRRPPRQQQQQQKPQQQLFEEPQGFGASFGEGFSINNFDDDFKRNDFARPTQQQQQPQRRRVPQQQEEQVEPEEITPGINSIQLF